MPSIGTNTEYNAVVKAAGWWYTVYLDRAGATFWSGNGRVDITATTSTADGLVWQAVSEDDPPPIAGHIDALRAHQATLVHQDIVAAWAEWELADGRRELVIQRADAADPDRIPAYRPSGDHLNPRGGWTLEQIAARLAFYGRAFGQGRVDQSALWTRLLQLGWTRLRVRDGSGSAAPLRRKWYYPGDAPASLADLREDLGAF
jgi:hypothetical protein